MSKQRIINPHRIYDYQYDLYGYNYDFDNYSFAKSAQTKQKLNPKQVKNKEEPG
ncbi:MAG: hypothetical protein ACE3NC_04845 [Candidatus Wallacebacter cryptica]|nr:hypothetical protein [Bacillota bacterium]